MSKRNSWAIAIPVGLLLLTGCTPRQRLLPMPNLRQPNQRPQPRQPNQARRSPIQATLDILDQPTRQAQTAKTARLALALRQLATAAAALQRLPGGGKAADALHKILDSAVNKGGTFYTDKKGQLARTTPPTVTGLGDSWLVQVAPWAMSNITSAVQAARVAVGRFGDNVKANLATATSYAAGKIAPLLDQLKDVPGLGQMTGLVRQAVNSAGALLGVTAKAVPVKEYEAKAVISPIRRTPAKARLFSYTRQPGGARAQPAADASTPTGARAQPKPKAAGYSLPMLAAGAAALFFVAPKLLK